MTYTPFHVDWKDFPDLTTPITAAALEYIEAGIQQAGGSTSTLGYYNVIDFGALGDTVSFTDGAISNGSSTFTSTEATFSSGDIGKIIVIKGAGLAYAAAPAALETSISAVGGAHSITLTDAASATVTDASFVYGTDDTVAIQGALDAASAAALIAAGNKIPVPDVPAGLATGDEAEVIASEWVHNGRAAVVIPGPQTYLVRSLTDQTWNLRAPTLTYSMALEMKSNVELVGIGLPRLYCNEDGQRVASQTARNIVGQVEGECTANWAIRGICFDGGYVAGQFNSTPGDEVAFPDALEDFFAIAFPRAIYGEITNCKFTGIYGDGIRVGDGYCRTITISDSYFTIFNGQAAQLLTADRGVISNNIIVHGQAAAGGSSEALNVGDGGGRVSIIGNVVVNCGCIGALGNETTVVGNYVAPNNGGTAAIEIGNSTGVTVSGNVCNMALFGCDITSSAKGIYANGSHNITITDNVILLSGGAMHANVQGIALAGDGTNATISNNTISAATTVTNATLIDIFSSDVASTITGNDCQACPYSIEVSGASSYVAGNNCSGFLSVGAAANTAQHIVVTGNRVHRTISVNSSANVITDNYIDASTSTNDDGETAFWFGVPDSNSNVIRNNTILGASGINVQGYRTGGSPYGLLDTFDNNLLFGGGVFNLGPTQTFRRAAGALTALAYSATIATDANLGELFTIAATDTSAYTISNPTSACAGMKITYDIKNSSGGSMGTITWGNKFLLAGAFTNPANTKRRTISFYYDGTNWVETNRAAADI